MRKLIFVGLLFCSLAVQAQLRPFYSATFDKYGYADSSARIVVPPKYDLAWEFREGMSAVKVDSLYGFVDGLGVEVITPSFQLAWMFSDGLSVVKTGGKFGFIDKSGALVVPAIYDRADNFHGDRANVFLNRQWMVMIYDAKDGSVRYR
jgi:hypothetical protein